jgi:hypothetical protein
VESVSIETTDEFPCSLHGEFILGDGADDTDVPVTAAPKPRATVRTRRPSETTATFAFLPTDGLPCSKSASRRERRETAACGFGCNHLADTRRDDQPVIEREEQS